MHPVVFYLLSVAALSISTGIGLFVVNQQYSRQNIYPQVSKAQCDHRNYKIFTLPNQIHVMIITSNRTELSAVALKEETGYMNDPKDFQGMSNYIQQLLQTSQKYPQADLLRKIIMLNAGKQMRIINEHESIYYAQVQNDAFFPLLDVISRLFIDPLFTKQQMDRVLQNLHAQWKSMELFDYSQQLISKSRHPYSQFYTGNLKTLFEIPENEGKNPYIEAKKFYRSKYSANRLSIVIYTNEELKKRVTELLFEYFNGCVDKQLQKITYKQFGLPLKNQRFFYIQSKVKELRIEFDFDIENNHLTKSLEFVILMLMKQFEKNFCDEMFEKKLAFKCYYTLKEIPKEFAIFKIFLHLPKQTKIDEILTSLYKRINYLKQQDNLEQYWDHLLLTQEINFQYSNYDIENIIQLSSNLKQYFSKDILQNKLLKKYDKAAISHVLQQMEPQNMTIILLDNFYDSYQVDMGFMKFGNSFAQQSHCIEEKKKIFKGKVKKRYRVYEDEINDLIIDRDHPIDLSEEEEFIVEPDDVIQTEQDYDIDKGYSIPEIENFSYHQLFGLHSFEAGITANTVQKLLNIKDTSLKIVDDSHIPTTFDLLPQSPDNQIIKKKKKNFKYPELLITTQAGNLWHIQDTINGVPKVQFRVLARFLDFESLGENFIAKEIVKLNFKIPKGFNVASIQIDIGVGQIEIIVQCFTQQIEEIAKQVMKNYQEAFTINKEDFQWYIENLEYQDRYWEKNTTTIEKALFYAKQILTNSQEFQQHKYDVKFEKIQETLKKLWDNQRFDILLYGNIDADSSKSLFESIIPKGQSKSKSFFTEETYKLSKRAITYRLAKLKSESIVTLNLYQGSDPSLVQYVYMRLLQRLMKFHIEDYLFNQLQLGFAVDVSLIQVNHIDSIVIIVQSNSYDPEEIDFYIEESLGYFESFLNRLPDKDFDGIKYAIQKQLQQVPNTLEQQAEIVWSSIRDGSYYFTQRECTILALEKISKSDLMKYFLIFFKARNSKLSLQLFKEGAQIPMEVLREQDTFAQKTSDLILNQEQFQQAIKETYKFKSKYIEQAPSHMC
ncbi:unnamed protein product [Paramecium primaurelia]|uniref:Uncharacterized protein n=1 Tax=Paramecium primaurelia TaxID=5886 RepID=A0A8S1K3S1_PARPR|nr:unnamed protein product [Paramecium primaurelia]